MMRVVDSYQAAVSVTPSDTVNITLPSGTISAAAIYVGVTGDITALMANGSTVLFKSVPVGTHRFAVKRINSTGTTATDIVALY